MSILIVDNDREERQKIAGILQGAWPEDLVFAESAKEAMERLKESTSEDRITINVLLVDNELPEGGGMELCRKIKSTEAHSDVSIILLSNRTDNIDEAFAAGVHDFLRRPIEKCDILPRIRSAQFFNEALKKSREYESSLNEIKRELQEMNSAIDGCVTSDVTTGLPNRIAFDEKLEVELQRSIREDRPISLLLVEVDFHETYLDAAAYGRDKFDNSMKMISEMIRGSLYRPGDSVARFNDSTLAVILPGTDDMGAKMVAETIRGGVIDLHIPFGASGAADHMTVSIGIGSTLSSNSYMADVILEGAETALSDAKKSGGNCTLLSVI